EPDRGGDQADEGDEGDGEDGAESDDMEGSSEERSGTDAEGYETEAERFEDDGGEAQEAGESRRRHPAWSDEAAGLAYRAYSTRFDEIVKAEELCEPEELDRLRAFLDKQLAPLQ